jgi:hypothetical protein
LAAHKQNKSTNPQQIKSDLESIVFDNSSEGKRKQQDIINRLVCNIDNKPVSGLQRHIARHNKTVLIRETLTERI